MTAGRPGPPRASRWARGLTAILSGSVAGQGVVVLAYPVLTRLYDPADLGTFAVFAAVVGVLAVASTGALPAALPVPVEDRDASAVAVAALLCVAATSLAVAVSVVAAVPLAELLGVPALAASWWLLPLTVLVMGVYEVLSQWMVRTESYGALGRRNLLQGAGQVATQITLGLVGLRPAGLLLGLGVGRLVALGGLLSRRGLLHQPRPTLLAVRTGFRRFRRFPLLAMPSDLINRCGVEVPLLVVSALYGDARAGLLALTVRVVGAPTTVVGQAVHQVFTGRSGVVVRSSGGTLGATVRTAVRRLLLVGLVPTVVLLCAGPALFALVFGAEWTTAGDFARFLALAFLLQFAITPVSATLFLLERQGQKLGWAVARCVLTVGGPAACALLGASIEVAVIALSAAHVVGYGALYVLSVRAADAFDAAAPGPPAPPQ